MKANMLTALLMAAVIAPICAPTAVLAQDKDYRWNGDRDGDWEPTHHYNEGQYKPRDMSESDRVYRGSDGRYYCKRDDGTTGLIVGGLAGGILGNIIAGGTLGTLLGAGGGALVGRSVDRDKQSVRCR